MSCSRRPKASPGPCHSRSSNPPAWRIRAEGIGAPIVLGFGVSSGDQARVAVGIGADGVVVGSAVLRAALNGRNELAALLRDLREGLNG